MWERVGRANWRPFEEARTFVRQLGLKSQGDWRSYYKSGLKPPDIPTGPDQQYSEWGGFGDWLGTETVAPRLRVYRSFVEARNFARTLGLASVKDWRAYTKSHQLPSDIPSTPNEVYASEGWKGWGDWLGTGFVAPRLRKYRSFEDARTFARATGLRSQSEWNALARAGRIPDDIPAVPFQTYAEYWLGWGDWLGTGRVRHGTREYRSFEDARAFARGLGFTSGQQWQAYAKSGVLPPDIPNAPHHVYSGEGWQGMGDWLGTGNIAPRLRKYRSFEDARVFAQSLGLATQKQWFDYSKTGSRPEDIPAAPHITYANAGWVGYGDWIGTGRKRNNHHKGSDYTNEAPVPSMQLSQSSENEQPQ